MNVRPINANELKVRMFRSNEFNRDTGSFDLPVVPWHDIEDAETLDYVPRQQWISVKDGVPPDRIDKPGSERCFVYGVTPEGKKVIAISRFYDGEWVLFGELVSSDVTHWMFNPNPELPKEGCK